MATGNNFVRCVLTLPSVLDTVGWSLELEAAYKNWVMYRLFAYGPADAIA